MLGRKGSQRVDVDVQSLNGEKASEVWQQIQHSRDPLGTLDRVYHLDPDAMLFQVQSAVKANLVRKPQNVEARLRDSVTTLSPQEVVVVARGLVLEGPPEAVVGTVRRRIAEVICQRENISVDDLGATLRAAWPAVLVPEWYVPDRLTAAHVSWQDRHLDVLKDCGLVSNALLTQEVRPPLFQRNQERPVMESPPSAIARERDFGIRRIPLTELMNGLYKGSIRGQGVELNRATSKRPGLTPLSADQVKRIQSGTGWRNVAPKVSERMVSSLRLTHSLGRVTNALQSTLEASITPQTTHIPHAEPGRSPSGSGPGF